MSLFLCPMHVSFFRCKTIISKSLPGFVGHAENSESSSGYPDQSERANAHGNTRRHRFFVA